MFFFLFWKKKASKVGYDPKVVSCCKKTSVRCHLDFKEIDQCVITSESEKCVKAIM